MGKIGKILYKIGKPGNFEEVYFFPVSAPVKHLTVLLEQNDWMFELIELIQSNFKKMSIQKLTCLSKILSFSTQLKKKDLIIPTKLYS